MHIAEVQLQIAPCCSSQGTIQWDKLQSTL